MDRYTVFHVGIKEDADGYWVKYTDVEALQRDRDSAVELCERMKVALNRIGTKDSYVAWAKECREAYDKVEALQARVRELEAKLEGAMDNMKVCERCEQELKGPHDER